jgi:hypothetical protein
VHRIAALDQRGNGGRLLVANMAQVRLDLAMHYRYELLASDVYSNVVGSADNPEASHDSPTGTPSRL